MLKKIFFSALVLTTILSCSSGDDSNGNVTVPSVEDSPPMSTNIDGVVYLMAPQSGGNFADASGGVYGSTYFLLDGYKNTSTAKVGSKVFQIKIAIPKSDVSIGTHNFTYPIAADTYYADLDISGVTPAETVNTTSGYVKVTSYNTTTKQIVGSFLFTTNNGVNTAVTTHTVSGSFKYILQ